MNQWDPYKRLAKNMYASEVEKWVCDNSLYQQYSGNERSENL